jgi:hypothetical protein
MGKFCDVEFSEMMWLYLSALVIAGGELEVFFGEMSRMNMLFRGRFV